MTQINLNDRRSQRTRKAIKQALVTLLSRQSLESITITQIAGLANINRKTFYMHFSSTKEVMDEIEDHVISSLQVLFDQTDMIQECYDPHFIFDSLSKVLKDDPQYYQYLLNAQSHSTLLSKLKTVLQPKIVKLLMHNFPLKEKVCELGVEFILAGTIALYQEWLDGDRTQDIVEVSQMANELATSCIGSMIRLSIAK